MGYSAITVIESLYKQDGGRLGDKNKLLEYVRGNVNTYRDRLDFGKTNVYTGNVASVLLVGISKSGSTITPQLIDVDVSQFTAISSNGDRMDTFSTWDGNYSESRPYSANYLSTMQQPGINMKYSELQDMNKAVASMPSGGGAKSDPNSATKPSQANCWREMDNQYSGASDESVLKQYEDKGVTDITHLFYSVGIIDELQTRYGYRTPDPTRPYSPFNWVRASDTASPSANCAYYKILYLPEFDALVHSGIISNPSLLTKSFVSSAQFRNMIASMTRISDYKLKAGDLENQTSIHYLHRIHSTMISKGERLLAGQYLYSKDFKYKLHLRRNGELFVWQLPVTAGGLDTPLYSMLAPSGKWAIQQNNVIACALLLQGDGNIVIYANPNVSVEYNGTNVPKITISDRNPIAATSTNFSLTSLSDNYSLITLPGGVTALLNAGVNSGKSKVSYVDGSIASNHKNTSNPYDLACINGYDIYKNGASNNTITDITEQNQKGTPWCYASPVVRPIDVVNGIMQFEDASLQLIVAEVGTDKVSYANAYDVYYEIVSGEFMAKAIGLGYNMIDDTIDTIRMGYCSRGNRFAKDPDCKKHMNRLAESRSGWGNVIDYKMRKQICAGTIPSEHVDACAVISPKSTVVASLAKIDPDFGIMSTSKSNTSYRPFGVEVSDVGAVMAKYTSYTTEQLDILFSAITPGYYAKWQNLYAVAAGVTPFNPPDFTKSPFYKVYKMPSVASSPSVFIFMNTTSGPISVSGEMDFPYNTSKTAYALSDPFWKRILISGSIRQNSKWAGAAFTPITLNDVKAISTPVEYNLITSTLYDAITIDITGEPAANAIVFIKSLSADKLIQYVRSLQDITTAEIASPTSNCKIAPDACFDKAIDYINNNPFDTVSNTWCDLALSPITRATDISYLSLNNGAKMGAACNVAYAKTKCALPESRYKSGFKDRGLVAYSSNKIFESFSGGTGCVSLCTTAPVDGPLYNACKIGSVEYCKRNSNIVQDVCRSDAAIYPEVQAMLTTWCNDKSNQSMTEYSTYCSSNLTPQTNMPVGAGGSVVEIPSNPMNELVLQPTASYTPPTASYTPPASSSAQPTSSSAQPTSSSAQPTSSSAQPTSSSAQPTSAPSASSAAPPVATSAQPTATTAPPTATPASAATSALAGDSMSPAMDTVIIILMVLLGMLILGVSLRGFLRRKVAHRARANEIDLFMI
jgi:hypothetical protein